MDFYSYLYYFFVQENRDELITRIGSIKKQILGSRGD